MEDPFSQIWSHIVAVVASWKRSPFHDGTYVSHYRMHFILLNVLNAQYTYLCIQTMHPVFSDASGNNSHKNQVLLIILSKMGCMVLTKLKYL